jgi:pilus assembly protein CpaE
MPHPNPLHSVALSHAEEPIVQWLAANAAGLQEIQSRLADVQGTVHWGQWQSISAIVPTMAVPSILLCALPLPDNHSESNRAQIWAEMEAALSHAPGVALIWLVLPSETAATQAESMPLPFFLQEAMRAGVREVLLNPFESLEIMSALNRQRMRLMALSTSPHSGGTERESRQGNNAEVIAFISAKGGSGSTVLATHWAWALAKKQVRVGVIDLDLMHGNAAMHLSDQSPAFTLYDAAVQADRLDGALLWSLMLECDSHLRVLPAPTHAMTDADVLAHITPAVLKRCLAALQTQVDVLVLDVGTSWSSITPWALQAAQTIALVAQPSLPHLHNVRHTLLALHDLGIDMARVQGVLNATARHAPMTAEEFQKALPELSWRCIPRSESAVAQAVHEGVAIGQYQCRDLVARALSRWADEWVQAHPLVLTTHAHTQPQGWMRWWPRWKSSATAPLTSVATSSVSVS